MRLWHHLALVAAAAVVLALVRSPLGGLVLVWIVLFLVLYLMDSVEGWIRDKPSRWKFSDRGMLVLVGSTLLATGLAFALKLLTDH